MDGDSHDDQGGGGEYVSLCCGAPVRVAGDLTQHYVCTGCLKPCDWTTPGKDT